MNFPSEYSDVLSAVDAIDPIQYARTRIFINGAVTHLSPYISRGVISTKFVVQRIRNNGFSPFEAEKIIQELAWRDYWQQVLTAKPEAVYTDLKHSQENVVAEDIPLSVLNASTGIEAIDTGIHGLYETGYMHNHVRMYTASLVCNIAQTRWLNPSRWMYYHLLDADAASNSLSWQWVAGTNSNKKYFANQENINKYAFTSQSGTFLDHDYETLPTVDIPDVLKQRTQPHLQTRLPQTSLPLIDRNKPTLIYNFYNLDPQWHSEKDANRILLLEPSHFEQFPVSPKTMDFILALAKNVKNIQIYTAEFDVFRKSFELNDIIFKKHPLFGHYTGTAENPDSIFGVTGYFPSFFSFWKQCMRKMKSL